MEAATVSIEEAGRALGISRGTAYALVRQHRFPVRVLRLGRQLKIPRAELNRGLVAEPQEVGNGHSP